MVNHSNDSAADAIARFAELERELRAAESLTPEQVETLRQISGHCDPHMLAAQASSLMRVFWYAMQNEEWQPDRLVMLEALCAAQELMGLISQAALTADNAAHYLHRHELHQLAVAHRPDKKPAGKQRAAPPLN
ncbi:MAG TPA: hypothetical protein PKZ35_09285 [Gammaproteobacteria bacterium]|nr:hypothetical protein [Gammaproteobacteria bacterium]